MNIHDLVTQLEEPIALELGKEVGEIVDRLHERYTDLLVFDRLTHEEVASLDMFGALMHLRVVSDRDRRLVVNEEIKRLWVA